MEDSRSEYEGVGAVGPESPFRRILVPIDGSDASIAAGRTALQIAAMHHLPVTMLYIVDDTVVSELTAASGRAQEAVSRELEAKGWHYLEHVAQIANQYGVACDRSVRRGMAHTQIANLARERDIDLIVIGETRSSNSRRAFSGSLIERVIDYAACSVLVVR